MANDIKKVCIVYYELTITQINRSKVFFFLLLFFHQAETILTVQ